MALKACQASPLFVSGSAPIRIPGQGAHRDFTVSLRRPRFGQLFAGESICSRRKFATVVSLSPIRNDETQGVRINKCLKSFASRRESDQFIAAKRVRINGIVAEAGARVFPGDRVEFDGKLIEWERLATSKQTESFTYLKYWKDLDIVCTTDETIPNNIISRIPTPYRRNDRIFPIGRLDEATTGLILLTSDGRLPNAILGAGKNCAKEYLVTSNEYISDDDLQRLQDGVVIKTVAHRDRNVRKALIAPTMPCQVERRAGKRVLIRLQEGRNRQIRKMLGALGYATLAIHRVGFMGITLHGLKGPGDARMLDETEMALVKQKLRRYGVNSNNAVR